MLPGGVTIRGMSGGELRRLSVCCGLVGNPSIIFLDEPTTGMLSMHLLLTEPAAPDKEYPSCCGSTRATSSGAALCAESLPQPCQEPGQRLGTGLYGRTAWTHAQADLKPCLFVPNKPVLQAWTATQRWRW